jgi:hypothetical protein
MEQNINDEAMAMAYRVAQHALAKKGIDWDTADAKIKTIWYDNCLLVIMSLVEMNQAAERAAMAAEAARVIG